MTDEERALLDYIADHFDTDRIERDGVFVRTRSTYSNRFRKGCIAGCKKGGYGYSQIGINAKVYMMHRIVYLWVHKHFPINHIDHINQDRQDNRPCNLRDVTPAENSKNRSKMHKNKTGTAGVKSKWTRKNGEKTWVGTVGRHGGSQYAQKSFRLKQDAIDFVMAKRKEFGYHENHGSPNTLQIQGFLF